MPGRSSGIASVKTSVEITDLRRLLGARSPVSSRETARADVSDTSAVSRRTPPLGGGAVAPVPLEHYGLTRREAEVLETLGERLSNAEIAARLYVSVRTVESHVGSLMRKFGVTRRRELSEIWATSRPLAAPLESQLPPALQLLADPATFVGRGPEQTRLADAWRTAKQGRLLVALVVGEAGIGKSRIAAELAAKVNDDGGRVLLGSCFEDLGTPYEPFTHILEADAAGLSDRELRARAHGAEGALARVAPELAARLGVAEPSSLAADSETERARTLAAFTWLPERDGAPGPTARRHRGSALVDGNDSGRPTPRLSHRCRCPDADPRHEPRRAAKSRRRLGGLPVESRPPADSRRDRTVRAQRARSRRPARNDDLERARSGGLRGHRREPVACPRGRMHRQQTVHRGLARGPL